MNLKILNLQLRVLDLKNGNFDELKTKLLNLTSNCNNLQAREIAQENKETPWRVEGKAKCIIAFVGHLIGNIGTLGLYGVYQNYRLKNRVKVLTAQNQYLQNNINNQNQLNYANLKNQLELFGDYLNLNQTDAGQAYHSVQEARRQQENLQKRLCETQRNFELIQTQKVKIELDKQKVDTDLLRARQQLEGEAEQLSAVGK